MTNGRERVYERAKTARRAKVSLRTPVKPTRMFDGKVYHLEGWSYKKSEAERRRNSLKKDGFLVRIVQGKGTPTGRKRYFLWRRHTREM